MFSKTFCGLVMGIDGIVIQVEADVSDGLPMFSMVGYLSSSVREASERVRTSLKNSGYYLPPKRITINLSPADLRKDGTAFDLAIALAILQSIGIIQEEKLNKTLIIGELSLNGDVVSVNGILPMVHCAYENDFKQVIVPVKNVKEASIINEIKVVGVANLFEAINYINNGIENNCNEEISINSSSNYFENTIKENDFCYIKGQRTLKRGVEIGVAGFHNILLTGVAGAGKTMIAKAIPTIMPPLTFKEKLEITKIYSVSGKLNENHLISNRPFRAPHHSVSSSGLIGGGKIPKPGEVSYAHNGVLFLDELPEFSKSTIELLRQPLEDKKINITRNYASFTFPSDFMLVSAMNPCPCGCYPDMNKCICNPYEIKKYQNKISKALIDRIDLNLQVGNVKYEDIFIDKLEEKSADIQERILVATKIQKNRYKDAGIYFNSQLDSKGIKEYIELGIKEENLIKEMYKSKQLSARGLYRILKVARTIADLEESEKININHINEALFFRNCNLDENRGIV